jgi:flagellar basal body-associated protein FliL
LSNEEKPENTKETQDFLIIIIVIIVFVVIILLSLLLFALIYVFKRIGNRIFYFFRIYLFFNTTATKKKSTKSVSFSLNRSMSQSRDDLTSVHTINSVTGLEANTINIISVVIINSQTGQKVGKSR